MQDVTCLTISTLSSYPRHLLPSFLFPPPCPYPFVESCLSSPSILPPLLFSFLFAPTHYPIPTSLSLSLSLSLCTLHVSLLSVCYSSDPPLTLVLAIACHWLTVLCSFTSCANLRQFAFSIAAPSKSPSLFLSSWRLSGTEARSKGLFRIFRAGVFLLGDGSAGRVPWDETVGMEFGRDEVWKFSVSLSLFNIHLDNSFSINMLLAFESYECVVLAIVRDEGFEKVITSVQFLCFEKVH